MVCKGTGMPSQVPCMHEQYTACMQLHVPSIAFTLLPAGDIGGSCGAHDMQGSVVVMLMVINTT